MAEILRRYGRLRSDSEAVGVQSEPQPVCGQRDRARIDFRSDLACSSRKVVVGYEYQFSERQNKSVLDWGCANWENIYPATQSSGRDETHILKPNRDARLRATGIWRTMRVASFPARTTPATEPRDLLPAVPRRTPFVNTRDNYQFHLGRRTRSRWKNKSATGGSVSGGFRYSRLLGRAIFFNQDHGHPVV